jgi:hypothetical protein
VLTADASSWCGGMRGVPVVAERFLQQVTS